MEKTKEAIHAVFFKRILAGAAEARASAQPQAESPQPSVIDQGGGPRVSGKGLRS